MTLSDFKSNVQKVTQSRHHTITNSLGVRLAFTFLQKNKWFDIGRPIKEPQFQLIIRQVNNLLAEEIIDGRDIRLPQRMGSLELRKTQVGATYDKNGNLKVSYPIDWDATLRLWYEDKESYNKRILIKSLDKEVFRVIYNRVDCNCPNKGFYEFHINRDIKRRLTKRIKQGRIDAFLR